MRQVSLLQMKIDVIIHTNKPVLSIGSQDDATRICC